MSNYQGKLEKIKFTESQLQQFEKTLESLEASIDKLNTEATAGFKWKAASKFDWLNKQARQTYKNSVLRRAGRAWGK